MKEFESSMARMAADPAIQKECAAIQRVFTRAESDGGQVFECIGISADSIAHVPWDASAGGWI